MNVLVLAPYRFDTAPGQRFRIEQWMPLLERAGVRFEFDAFMSQTLHEILYRPGRMLKKTAFLLRDYAVRLARCLSPGRYDAIFLHREAALIGPAWIERVLRASGIPIIYEFDDAIYVPYISPSNKYLSYLKFPQKTATICRLSSHVVVGNEILRDYAARHNSHVSIVPTTIDTEKYRPSCRYDWNGSLPVLGWSGSYSSVQYLEIVRPALEKLARRRPFRLEIIGATTFQMDEVPLNAQTWRAETEVEDLSRIQIGLMPLPDEDWAKGKCALKALQYMALGIPTVLSPVGVNRDVVRDGENGFHAGSTDEWVDKLERLLADAALRRRLGEAGRETVVRDYSAQVHAPRLLDILQSVARG